LRRFLQQVDPLRLALALPELAAQDGAQVAGPLSQDSQLTTALACHRRLCAFFECQQIQPLLRWGSISIVDVEPPRSPAAYWMCRKSGLRPASVAR
jgi:hypothetical protein